MRAPQPAAAIHVTNCGDGMPSIRRSFTTLGPPLQVAPGSAAGECIIEFGADIRETYVSASAVGGLPNPRAVSCERTSNTALTCVRWDKDGLGVTGQIVVLVFR